jgi:hypothetical protein
MKVTKSQYMSSHRRLGTDKIHPPICDLDLADVEDSGPQNPGPIT